MLNGELWCGKDSLAQKTPEGHIIDTKTVAQAAAATTTKPTPLRTNGVRDTHTDAGFGQSSAIHSPPINICSLTTNHLQEEQLILGCQAAS